MPYTVKTTARTETGKGRIRKLRRTGIIPAVVYGHGDPSIMLSLDEHAFGLLLRDICGHSPIVQLELNGETTRCVIKTLQRNPINGHLLHVDFQKVHPDEKITIHVPVLLHGAARGVKEGGLLDHILREVAVRATIDNIPSHFDIDISDLGFAHSIHISDLKAENVEFMHSDDSAVVTVLAPRKLVEEEKPEAEAAATAEGEIPTEEATKEAEAAPAAEDEKKKKKKK
jgi:large subunit ribosomal protein L25